MEKYRKYIIGFIGLAICYVLTAVASIPGVLPEQLVVDGKIVNNASVLSYVFAGGIMLISAVPMALLGIIPQSIVADVAEAEAKVTGQNREGMFFAARTFAFKMGQAIAMVVFTSVTVAKTPASYRASAGIATVTCLIGACLFLLYNEKMILGKIEELKKK